MDIAGLLRVKQPELVYHYTTPQGFLGITQSKSVWATSIHYLNDSDEFLHALRLMEGELNRRLQSASGMEAEVLRFLASSFAPIKELKIFVCSFSEEGDLLSQWRGYCPDGGGVSMGFDFAHIRNCAASQSYMIGPCLYDANSKSKVISSAIDGALPKIREMLGKVLENHVRGYFYQHVVMVAPFIKHPAFEEEKEWRCALLPSIEQVNECKYRVVGRSLLIPYHELRLVENDVLKVNKIVVGPTDHKKLQLNTIGDILVQRGVKWGSISYSSAPYRVW